jgi:hypothetical protein
MMVVQALLLAGCGVAFWWSKWPAVKLSAVAGGWDRDNLGSCRSDDHCSVEFAGHEMMERKQSATGDWSPSAV